MRSDATVMVICDECETYDEQVELTALAGGGWDERNVDGQLKRHGWRKDGDRDICPACCEEAPDADA